MLKRDLGETLPRLADRGSNAPIGQAMAQLVVADRPLLEALVESPSRPSGSNVDCGNGGSRFSLRAPPARNSSPRVIFENISLPPSSPRLTSNGRTARFDNSTKRGNALDTCWNARD